VFLNYKVHRHLAFEAVYVTLAEVIAQFVNLISKANKQVSLFIFKTGQERVARTFISPLNGCEKYEFNRKSSVLLFAFERFNDCMTINLIAHFDAIQYGPLYCLHGHAAIIRLISLN
jgi:hypothetical protein